MGYFTSKEFNSLEDIFWDQVRDLYDAEQRLLKALPKMADAASNKELKEAFKSHLADTERQVGRLEQIFRRHQQDPKRESCEAMKGIISEGEEIVDAKGPDTVKDHALIVAAQRVEHYEMAGYGGARAIANRIGFEEDAQLLQETLTEEGEADHKLTKLADSVIGNQPAHA